MTETATAPAPGEITEAQLRRWLGVLQRPDRPVEPELMALLHAHGRLPPTAAPSAVGKAAAELLTQAIERLRPPAGATRRAELTYTVLKTCFVDGSKIFQVANRLSMSERQVSRERARGLDLLRAELVATPQHGGAAAYQEEPIPAILGFLPRADVVAALTSALDAHRRVHVHGARGIGKSSLVAEVAVEAARATRVLWFRVRPGVNDSLAALLFELGEYLNAQSRPRLATYIGETLPEPDLSLASRVALKELAAGSHLLVLDDFQAVEGDAAVGGFLAEAASRLTSVRVLTIGRHRVEHVEPGIAFAVPPLDGRETHALLEQLGVRSDAVTAERIHAWTGGVPQLVKLSASWLKTATTDEVDESTTHLGELDAVQDFLLGCITELLGSNDRAILDAASIFRDRFTDNVLAHVAGLPRSAVIDASRRLVHCYVATRSRAGDVAFFHASVRDYVYARLSPESLARLHERAADWYAERDQAEEARYHRAAARTPS